MVEVAFESEVLPETVSAPKVPTDVKEEFTTAAPSVVAFKTCALLIETAPPVARLRLPAVSATPPAKVEVAVEVAVMLPTVRLPIEDEAS